MKKITVKNNKVDTNKAKNKTVKSKKRLQGTLSKTVMSYSKVVKAKVAKARKLQNKVVRMDALDQLLLKITAKPYNKILKQIKLGKQKLSDERKLALQLGSRILKKAKEVRDSLMSSSPKNRG